MTELFSLIKTLNAEERQIIKLSFQKHKSDSSSFLIERLFNAISTSTEKNLSDAHLSAMIYSNKKGAAINKLKSRLFQHILDVLGSENSLLHENIFDPSDRHELRIRKKMYSFRVLYRKKNRADFVTYIHILNEVIKEAKEYELYDVLLEALRHKLIFFKIRKGFKEIEQIKRQIEKYSFAYEALLKTYDIYYDLMTNIYHVQDKSSAQVKASLKSDLKEMKGLVEITGSAFIEYLYNMIRLEELQREEKYEELIGVCQEQVALIKRKKFLYREERLGNIYDNISQCQVFNGDFEEAIKSAHKAQSLYSRNLRSFIVSKVQEFHATFYSGDYKKALQLIDYILGLKLENIGDFSADRFLFFKACVLFGLSRFRDSMDICNAALELTKDKGRWDLGIKYMRLMNIINLEDFDLADDAIEALRKSIGRSDKNEFIGARDKLILKVFKEYCKTGFNTLPSERLLISLKELSARDKNVSWKYYSHELFPIQGWISSRLEKKTSRMIVYKKNK